LAIRYKQCQIGLQQNSQTAIYESFLPVKLETDHCSSSGKDVEIMQIAGKKPGAAKTIEQGHRVVRKVAFDKQS